jgi:phosphohistidine phosphatase SixA
MTNYVETAHGHANEAERIVADVHEHLSKRGRKMGEQQANELALASTHAQLATFYMLAASAS